MTTNRNPWPLGLRPAIVSGGDAPVATRTELDPAAVDDIFGRIVRDSLAARQRPGIREERGGGRFELRTDETAGGSAVGIAGYFTTFDDPYPMYGGKNSAWGWDETIVGGALDKSINDRADVRLLINHDGLPLARTKSGTLTLTADTHGGHVSADLDPDDPDVRALVPKMRRRDVDQMSWAFEVIRQEWNGDLTERWITEARQFDAAIVTFPANEGTEVGLRALRSLDLPLSAAHTERLAHVFAELRSGNALTDAALDALTDARDQARGAADLFDELLAAATRDADPAPDPLEAQRLEAEAIRTRLELDRARRNRRP